MKDLDDHQNVIIIIDFPDGKSFIFFKVDN